MKKIWNELTKSKTLKSVMTGMLFVAFSCMVATGCGNTEALSQEQEKEIVTTVTESETAVTTVSESETSDTESEATNEPAAQSVHTQPSTEVTISVADIPAYAGDPYVTINDNVPQFLETDLATSSYEYYSDLDDLDRCGVVYACIGTDLMPTEERGNIGSVKPSGWHTVKYDIVDGKYLYNRCHLIGYQLTAENANVKNLITGTRYLNVQGMLPFENLTADYVKETGNHVMYRVTPVFEGSNLVASGVLMEAYSVEDQGKGICFCTYCYNVQPGVAIDYATGDSHLNGKNNQNSHNSSAKEHASAVYILNTNTKKFHKPNCYSVKQMSSKNRKKYKGLRKKLIKDGYSPCKNCNP